jgi:organic hydroperoxide reductase OsmC/OhrA
MALTVKATVPQIDKGTFDRLVEETRLGCPVSRSLKAVDIQVQAGLT